MLEYFEKIKNYFDKPNHNSLGMSLADVHHKGLFSLVIKGTEPGQLTRVFVAEKKIRPFELQLHSHRYPIKLTVLKGQVRQHVATQLGNEAEGIRTSNLSRFKYESPMNGGKGLEFEGYGKYFVEDYYLPVGSINEMDEKEIHTISCEKDSMWIVEELGFKTNSSVVLGVPFKTEGLYNTPFLGQTGKNFTKVKKVIKDIVESYNNLL